MFISQIPKRFLLVLVRGYQYLISPLFPPCCRFTPTCSAYTIQAIEKYGVFRGLFLSFRRILRCHPFSAGGYDPVR
ncbi:MAG: membrane protein insertion efficiency factor YidD [Desulfobulbaceae bacterium]|nr:MAG: membrane protein insertion efficiency factor YidD [Desulfobulbaceae bacterium]